MWSLLHFHVVFFSMFAQMALSSVVFKPTCGRRHTHCTILRMYFLVTEQTRHIRCKTPDFTQGKNNNGTRREIEVSYTMDRLQGNTNQHRQSQTAFISSVDQFQSLVSFFHFAIPDISTKMDIFYQHPWDNWIEEALATSGPEKGKAQVVWFRLPPGVNTHKA